MLFIWRLERWYSAHFRGKDAVERKTPLTQGVTASYLAAVVGVAAVRGHIVTADIGLGNRGRGRRGLGGLGSSKCCAREEGCEAKKLDKLHVG
jgi:hypothetical protein